MMQPPDFPTLSTERLSLEPFSMAHSKGIFRLWSSPEVCRYAGEAADWERRPIALPAQSHFESDKILDFFIRRAAAGTGNRWAMVLVETGECMGALGLNALDPIPELAYHLHPDYWQSGYASEACRAVIQWSKTNLRASNMIAFIDGDNAPSIRLVEALGFTATPSSRDGAARYALVLERPD